MFKKKIQYYADLSPSERIPEIIKEFIFPELEKIGFKILKSGLLIKREKNGFIQEIWFSKSKWNTGNEICEIEPHFSVTRKNYIKWYKDFYKTDLNADIVLSNSAYYIEGWDLKTFDGSKYDFAKHDNQILVDLIVNNILDKGLVFLDTLSDNDTLTKYLMNDERYYKAPMMIDLKFMVNDYENAKKISDWFWDYKNKSDDDFMESTIIEMIKRQEILNNMA